MIYKQTEDTVYEDRCCHVEKLGNDIIANKIASTISEYYKTNKAGH